jgi:Undecaprenyl-phosphate galactose phosphotransferase WbaP
LATWARWTYRISGFVLGKGRTETENNSRNTDVFTRPPKKGDARFDAQPAARPESQGQVWRQWLTILTLVSSDILLALLFWGLAFVLQGTWGRGPLNEVSIAFIAPYTAVWIGMRVLLGLYPGYGLNPAEELRRQTYAALGALAITAIFAVGFQMGDYLSRLLVGLIFLELLLLAPLVRHFVKRSLAKIGLWGKPVVVLGVGETAKLLVRTLQSEWGLGFRPVAAFDFRMAPTGGLLEGVPYGGTVTDALALARKQRIDTVIFAMPRLEREHLAMFVERASLSFRHVIIIPNLNGVTTSAITARDFVGIFGVELKHNLLIPWNLRAKRMLDLITTIVGGIMILPLLLVISLLVWMDARGHVFYRAQRMGQDGKLFSCVKFRTMVPDAEDALQQILKENAELKEEYSKYHKLRDDPRVTRIGRILRKSSLDELPQLYNVLRGEMSLVGPRPYLPRESEKIGVAQSEILRVPPGITGPWQVAGRNRTSFTERVQMDAYYVRNWSVWLDFIILARTIMGLNPGRGAY